MNPDGHSSSLAVSRQDQYLPVQPTIPAMTMGSEAWFHGIAKTSLLCLRDRTGYKCLKEG
jgi:hypothetical protein